MLFERELELEPPPVFPDDRAAELRLRDEAADVRRLEALPLFGLLRDDEDLLADEEDLLPEDALRLRLLLLEALWLLGLEPFEPREFVFCLFDERVLPWAMAPP